MRSKVRHCTGTGDPQLSVLISCPLHRFTQIAARNGGIDKFASRVVNTVVLCKRLGIGAFCYIQHNLIGALEGTEVDIGHTLRNVHALQTEAVAERIRTEIRHGFGENNCRKLRIIVEGKNANRGQLTAFLKYDLSHVLSIAERIVTNRGDILADNDLRNHCIGSVPRLFGVRNVVRHRAATANFQHTVGIELPRNRAIEIAGLDNLYTSLSQFNRQIVTFSIQMADRIFGDLQNKICIGLIENVCFHIDNIFGNVNTFNGTSTIECRITNRFELTVFFKTDARQSTALIERIAFKNLDACRNLHISGQTPVVTEGTPRNRLQRRILLKGNRSQIYIFVEAEAADLGNTATNLQSGDRSSIILDNPRRIQSIGGVILHLAFTVDLQQSIAQQNILNVCTAEAGIDNRGICRGNKCPLLIKETRVTQHINLAADSHAVCIVEINLGVDIDLAGSQLTGSKITVCIDRLVKEESVESCLVGTNTVFTKVVIVTIDFLQTNKLHAVHIVGIILPTVGNNNAVNIGLTVGINTVERFAASALQHVIDHLIGMAGSRNRGTPIHNGLTGLTEGTIGVAVLGTGSSLVINRFSSVNVAAVPSIKVCKTFCGSRHIRIVGPHFGIAEDTLTGKGIGAAVHTP